MIFKELHGKSGIPHIEDLSIDKFINTLYNLDEYLITEKIDGSQILFGIDANGFYTSRETKGGNRIYESKNYPLNFSSVYMRSAHDALLKILPLLESAGFEIGDQIEAEVLYGEIPNAIPYSKDVNHIVFLRVTEGFVDLNKLKKISDNQTVTLKLKVPFTEDGKIIKLKEEFNNWKFSSSPEIKYGFDILNKELKPKLNKINSYLNEQSEIKHLTNKDILTLPLNVTPKFVTEGKWKEVKNNIKNIKEDIQIKYNSLILETKELLLDNLVRNQQSGFGPALSEGGCIEGVVLRHPISKEQVKVVDKNTFSKTRDYVWESRLKLTEKVQTPNNASSFIGKVLVGLASAMGHPYLGTTQSKKYLRQISENKEDLLSTLTENINFTETKEYCLNFIKIKRNDLTFELIKYNSSIKESIFSEIIEKRTKQAFAEMFKQLEIFETKIKSSRDSKDLILVIAEKQISEIL